MALSRELVDKLFEVEEQLKAAGMGDLSGEEIRGLAQKAMAPMPRPNMVPMAGFQGNSMFPNQSGGGLLQQGQPAPPMSAQPLDTRGQMMPQGQPQGFPGQQMMAQSGQPGQQGGFNTTIQLGPDGQLSSLMIKRALQKKLQQQGGVA